MNMELEMNRKRKWIDFRRFITMKLFRKLLVLVAVIFFSSIFSMFLITQEKQAGGEVVSPPKITKVVLYKHGLGYFETLAKVKGNAVISLNFKLDAMKDLLKSFYAIDLGNGKITNISYDSKEPMSKQLEDILIRIPEDNALTGFLAGLKGCKIRLLFSPQGVEVTGTILGIEPIKEEVEKNVVTKYKLVILEDDGVIRYYDTLEVRGFELLDEPLKKDLKRALEVYLKSKYVDRKAIKVYTDGKGEREIQMGYLIETPIWKTSYRLLFTPEGKALLQGWAMIENTTTEDWSDVELSLVAGNPISFIMDLYTSYTPLRPEIPISSLLPAIPILSVENIARAPAPLAESIELEKEEGGYGRSLKAVKKATVMKEEAKMIRDKSLFTEELIKRVEEVAKGMNVGDLFSYKIKDRVSINAKQSALVPIINSEVDASKILYYNEDLYAKYPMNSVYLKNTTPLTLDSGPITFFEAGTNLGEGVIKTTMKQGMKNIISYAIETGVSIEKTTNNSSGAYHRITITNGILTANYYYLNNTTYKCKNETGKDLVLYIDHHKTQGFELIEPKKAEEELPGIYRFKINLPKNETTILTISERTEYGSYIYLENVEHSPEILDQIKTFIKEPKLSEKSKKFLEELVEIIDRIAQLSRAYDSYDTEYKRLSEDQERYRKNINTLGNTAFEQEQKQRFVKKLVEVEEKMAQLRGNMRENEDTRVRLKDQLIKKIREFSE